MIIQYDDLKTQKYMTSPLFSNYTVKLLVNMRSSLTKDIKNNFSSIFKGNMACRLKCSNPNAIYSQQYLILCSALTEHITKEQGHIKFVDIFGSLKQQREPVLLLAKLLEAGDPGGREPDVFLTPIQFFSKHRLKSEYFT